MPATSTWPSIWHRGLSPGSQSQFPIFEQLQVCPMSAPADFTEAIARAFGAAPDPADVRPGKLVRFSTNGKKHDDSGWAKLFEDGRAGVFGNWRTGEQGTWRAAPAVPMSRADRQRQRAEIAAAQAARELEQAQRHARAAELARLIWTNARPCDGHPYLDRKRVAADGVRVQFAHAMECRGQFCVEGQSLRGLLLLVPVRDMDRRLWSLQAIDAEGRKSFLRGGRARGLFHVVGGEKLRPVVGQEAIFAGTVAIAEGYATARSVVDIDGWPCVVAFNAGNLAPVARSVRAKFPRARLMICGDNDFSGVGQRAAEDAAEAVGGWWAVPPFSLEEAARGCTDWNDYAQLVRNGERSRA